MCATCWQTIEGQNFVNHFTYSYIDGMENKANIFNVSIEKRFDRVNKNCLPQIGL